MNRLYITEKASLGRALANALPGEKRKEEHYIRCGEDVVAWASGHLLRLFDPEDYDSDLKLWSLGTLPVIPKCWKYKAAVRTKTLLDVIGTLLKSAESVVHAGDMDREGQLLVDNILQHFNWKGPTLRLLINDVNPDAIRKALQNMKDNEHYRPISLAGRARSYADWLAGYNLTRWCTLQAENAGYDLGVGRIFSIGRVQTPTLGLVVRRDREIENFVSKSYYVLVCTLNLSENRRIVGRMKMSESSGSELWTQTSNDSPSSDSMELPVSKGDYQLLCEKCDKIRGRGVITGVDKKVHKKTPHLPYSLSKLQIDASKLYDVTDTLAHAQRLYEQGYISYPRTDCSYLPEGHHAQASLVLDAIASACSGLRDLLIGVDVSRKSPAWNDSKVQEHHAVIPSVKVPLEGALSDIERKIYNLVARRYVLQFLPDCEYEEVTVEFSAGGEMFRASGRTVLVPGWTRWDKEETKNCEEGGCLPTLPSVSVGETGETEPFVEEKKTTPPKRFTYDTLLGAMNSIYLYVEDPEIRKQLKKLDGIGTAATQESILALLFERGYIEKHKKQLFSTQLGRALIDLLSAGKSTAFVTPDLTALWEQKMTRIEKGELSQDEFVSEVGVMVKEIVSDSLDLAKIREISALPRKKRCLAEGCDGYLVRKSGAYGPFFFCPTCKHVFRERDGEPEPSSINASSEVTEADCPMGCGKKARRFEGKYGPFWKCFCSPNVKFQDVDGKPAMPEERVPSVSANCPVKKCKGTAVRYNAKSNGRPFWKCDTCKNFFDDADGKPLIREKHTKSGRS
jgi:DNA topoisomerase-3